MSTPQAPEGDPVSACNVYALSTHTLIGSVVRALPELSARHCCPAVKQTELSAELSPQRISVLRLLQASQKPLTSATAQQLAQVQVGPTIPTAAGMTQATV